MMSILVKDDDVSSETRPRLELFTAGYGRHGSQWVKIMQKRLFAKSDYQGEGGGPLSTKHEEHTCKAHCFVPIRVLKSQMTTIEIIVNGTIKVKR